MGIGSVDQESLAYSYGEYAGIGASFLTGGITGWKAAGTKAPGLEFSHWVQIDLLMVFLILQMVDNLIGKIIR